MSDGSLSETNPFAGMPCRDCGAANLKLELRPSLDAQPLGGWSLAGAQMKLSAVVGSWPWCVCGTCGSESKGQIDV